MPGPSAAAVSSDGVMLPMFVCADCGAAFVGPMAVSGGGVEFRGNRASCPNPRCGGWAYHQDGLYGIVHEIAAAAVSSEIEVSAAVKELGARYRALAAAEAAGDDEQVRVLWGDLQAWMRNDEASSRRLPGAVRMVILVLWTTPTALIGGMANVQGAWALLSDEGLQKVFRSLFE